MSNNLKKFRDYFFIIGVAILFFMAYKLGFTTIMDNLSQTGWWFLAILSIWILVYYTNALSLSIIIGVGNNEQKKVSNWHLFKLTISAYAINYITPLGIGGEPYKVLELRSNLGTHKATSSVLLYIMMHYVSHFIFWFLSVPLFLTIVPVIPASIKIILWAIIIGSVILIYSGFTVYKKGIIGKAIKLGCKLPFVGRRIRIYKVRNQERIEEMDFLIGDLYNNNKKKFFLSLGVELLSRYISCLEVYFMIMPMSFEISFIQCILIVSFATLVANIFFFAPMQMGVREGGFALAVSFLSIPAGLGVYIGLCTRIRELFWILIGIGLTKLKFAPK
ncbi:MAG TPA: lysylphosphatidylglycerol synthase transmembrane domain-containing protein [Paludibacter sp.]|nr:lysylphosphatidylglycerol synthase transmembrane domain-containing protein [Paludibacter sp.]